MNSRAEHGNSRASNGAVLEKPIMKWNFHNAQQEAELGAKEPIRHGRWCLLGLAVLQAIRIASWCLGNIPASSVTGMHLLTTTADLSCIFFTVPLMLTGVQGRCVQQGCLGPVLTLVFAMVIVDLSAFGSYLIVAAPRPLHAGAKSYVDTLEACIGAWEFALFASVALQLALSISVWRIYRELRLAGLYPPGSEGNMREISVLEVMCEAEDVELLAQCEGRCSGQRDFKTEITEDNRSTEGSGLTHVMLVRGSEPFEKQDNRVDFHSLSSSRDRSRPGE